MMTLINQKYCFYIKDPGTSSLYAPEQRCLPNHMFSVYIKLCRTNVSALTTAAVQGPYIGSQSILKKKYFEMCNVFPSWT